MSRFLPCLFSSTYVVEHPVRFYTPAAARRARASREPDARQTLRRMQPCRQRAVASDVRALRLRARLDRDQPGQAAPPWAVRDSTAAATATASAAAAAAAAAAS